MNKMTGGGKMGTLALLGGEKAKKSPFGSGKRFGDE